MTVALKSKALIYHDLGLLVETEEEHRLSLAVGVIIMAGGGGGSGSTQVLLAFWGLRSSGTEDHDLSRVGVSSRRIRICPLLWLATSGDAGRLDPEQGRVSEVRKTGRWNSLRPAAFWLGDEVCSIGVAVLLIFDTPRLLIDNGGSWRKETVMDGRRFLDPARWGRMKLERREPEYSLNNEIILRR